MNSHKNNDCRCRLCSSEFKLFRMFRKDSQYIGDYFRSVIWIFFGIKIEPNDQETSVCMDCLVDINNFYYFKLASIERQKEFETDVFKNGKRFKLDYAPVEFLSTPDKEKTYEIFEWMDLKGAKLVNRFENKFAQTSNETLDASTQSEVESQKEGFSFNKLKSPITKNRKIQTSFKGEDVSTQYDLIDTSFKCKEVSTQYDLIDTSFEAKEVSTQCDLIDTFFKGKGVSTQYDLIDTSFESIEVSTQCDLIIASLEGKEESIQCELIGASIEGKEESTQCDLVGASFEGKEESTQCDLIDTSFKGKEISTQYELIDISFANKEVSTQCDLIDTSFSSNKDSPQCNLIDTSDKSKGVSIQCELIGASIEGEEAPAQCKLVKIKTESQQMKNFIPEIIDNKTTFLKTDISKSDFKIMKCNNFKRKTRSKKSQIISIMAPEVKSNFIHEPIKKVNQTAPPPQKPMEVECDTNDVSQSLKKLGRKEKTSGIEKAPSDKSPISTTPQNPDQSLKKLGRKEKTSGIEKDLSDKTPISTTPQNPEAIPLKTPISTTPQNPEVAPLKTPIPTTLQTPEVVPPSNETNLVLVKEVSSQFVNVCRFCSAVFDSKRQFMLHRKTHCRCQLCKINFKTLHQAEVHAKVCTLKNLPVVKLNRVELMPDIVENYPNIFD